MDLTVVLRHSVKLSERPPPRRWEVYLTPRRLLDGILVALIAGGVLEVVLMAMGGA